MVRTVRIGSRTLGPGHPAFIIGEAGSNHNGNLEQAKALIDVAAEAGCDAVKFQTFRATHLYAPAAGESDYLQVRRSIVDIIREMEMPWAWMPELAAHAQARGLEFMSTGFDEAAVDALDPFVAAHKVASYELTHLPLIEHVARKGKPILMSTGAGEMEEVREAVATARKAGCEDLVLLQCTAKYPAPLESLHLRVLPTLQREFDVLTGLSDHSAEPVAGPAGAIALGGVVVEKHFTLSKRLPGPDHKFAVEPHELKAMVQAIRQTERALGVPEKRPDPAEAELRDFARRYLYLARDLPEGATLGPDDVLALRSGKAPKGLPPRELPSVLGRRVRRAMRAGDALGASDLA